MLVFCLDSGSCEDIAGGECLSGARIDTQKRAEFGLSGSTLHRRIATN